MATQTTSVKTDFTTLTDFFTYLGSIASIVPSFRKHPVTKLPVLDVNGNKELVGFVAVDLSSEIKDITDTDIKELQVSVKSFKNHWSVFKPSDDSRMFGFGKFNNWTDEEKLSRAEDL